MISIFQKYEEINPKENHYYVRRICLLGLLMLVIVLAAIANIPLQKATVALSTDTCACPAVVTSPDCTNSEKPVFGGLDFVQYFNFPNDSYTGEVGLDSHSAVYKGYTFYFLSKANRQTFKEEPDKYIPQWGGFCAWGMSGEYCPQYPWAADCLGPSGNWGIWTKVSDRLYFFYVESAKELFLSNTSYYISQGDSRWSSWFDATSVVFNTKCYFKSSSQFINRNSYYDSANPNISAMTIMEATEGNTSPPPHKMQTVNCYTAAISTLRSL